MPDGACRPGDAGGLGRRPSVRIVGLSLHGAPGPSRDRRGPARHALDGPRRRGTPTALAVGITASALLPRKGSSASGAPGSSRRPLRRRGPRLRADEQGRRLLPAEIADKNRSAYAPDDTGMTVETPDARTVRITLDRSVSRCSSSPGSSTTRGLHRRQAAAEKLGGCRPEDPAGELRRATRAFLRNRAAAGHC
jgi:hypothetical protein